MMKKKHCIDEETLELCNKPLPSIFKDRILIKVCIVFPCYVKLLFITKKFTYC